MLSGNFTTGQLPKIGGGEPITVIVGRKVVVGRELEFEAAAVDVIAKMSKHAGCLGAGLLKPGTPGGEYQIVFRFADALSLRAWERSPQRELALEDVDDLVTETRIQRSVGVDDFMDSIGRASIKRSMPKHIAVEVAWGFPFVVCISLLLGPALAKLPFEVRTLLSMGAITTAVNLIAGPIRRAIRRRRRLE